MGEIKSNKDKHEAIQKLVNHYGLLTEMSYKLTYQYFIKVFTDEKDILELFYFLNKNSLKVFNQSQEIRNNILKEHIEKAKYLKKERKEWFGKEGYITRLIESGLMKYTNEYIMRGKIRTRRKKKTYEIILIDKELPVNVNNTLFEAFLSRYLYSQEGHFVINPPQAYKDHFEEQSSKEIDNKSYKEMVTGLKKEIDKVSSSLGLLKIDEINNILEV